MTSGFTIDSRCFALCFIRRAVTLSISVRSSSFKTSLKRNQWCNQGIFSKPRHSFSRQGISKKNWRQGSKVPHQGMKLYSQCTFLHGQIIFSRHFFPRQGKAFENWPRQDKAVKCLKAALRQGIKAKDYITERNSTMSCAFTLRSLTTVMLYTYSCQQLPPYYGGKYLVASNSL